MAFADGRAQRLKRTNDVSDLGVGTEGGEVDVPASALSDGSDFVIHEAGVSTQHQIYAFAHCGDPLAGFVCVAAVVFRGKFALILLNERENFIIKVHFLFNLSNDR
jgi:hypothetical protein